MFLVGARISVWYIKIKTCWYILPPCLALSDTTASTSEEKRETARADFLFSQDEEGRQRLHGRVLLLTEAAKDMMCLLACQDLLSTS